MPLGSGAGGLRRAPSLFRAQFNSLKEKSSGLQGRLESITFPEKYKGMILEKWANYWKNLVIDYKEMIIDTGRTMRERPLRSSVYVGLLGAGTYCWRNNPTETDFWDQYRQAYNDLTLVDPNCQNPVATQHLTFVERCNNEGIIRRMSIGVMSFIWLDNYDRGVAIYKAICPYLQPRYVTLYQRIVDVGFNNKWWILDTKMVDYDINEENL